MIRSIEIKNLRGIQEGRLDDLTPLVVLVGPNGSGKSTVLDALLIGASPRPSDAIYQITTERAKVEQESRWLLWRGERGVHAEVRINTDQPNEHRVIRLSSVPVTDSSSGGGFGGGGTSRSTSDRIRYDIQIKLSVNPDNPSDPGIPIGSIADSSSSGPGGELHLLLGVPDIRLVELGRKEKPNLLVDLFTRALDHGRREEARGILGDVIPGATNVEIGTHDGVPRLQVVYPDHSVPIALAGDGIQSLARLCLELASCPDGVVLLEEPEVHQHPGAIRQSARAIWAAVRRDIQVILSTHSLELIDALLSEAKEDAELEKLSVYRTLLQDGCLKQSRVPGPDVAFLRGEIGDDLR